MLSIFVGPSGSGKTTLMERLCRDFGCKLLKNYTTRQLRPGETARSWLPEDDALKRFENGEFEFLNLVFGNYYWVTRVDFGQAIRSNDLYLFDIHWSHLHKIVDKVQCVVIFNGVSFSTVLNRLVVAGRTERINQLEDEISAVKALHCDLANGPLQNKLVDAADGLRPGLAHEIIECAARNRVQR